MSYQKVNHGFLITGNILDDAGNSYDISGGILDVMFLKSYIENVFPLITIDFRTTEDMRNIMRDRNVSVYLRISYYNVDDVSTVSEEDSNEVVEAGLVFEGNIRIYDKPYPTTAAKIETETEDAETQRTAAPFVYYRMSGIPENLIKKNETNMNAIYKNCEIIDAAIQMFTKVDLEGKFLIEETTNKEIEKFILVPPVSLAPAIQYIDEKYYHMYQHPANLFFDMDTTYLYDPISNNSPTTNIVECNIISADATGSVDDIYRPKLDSDGNIKLTYKNLPYYNYTLPITTHSVGSHAIFYYYDDNFNLITRTEDESKSYEKIRYLWEKLTVKSYELLKQGEHISLSLNSINPNLINPLTNFRIISSEYPKPEGDYRILTNSFSFSSTDLKHYKSKMVLGLVKKK